ncbi:hypothetical protein WDU94_010011 [Cyamophila willieti]
MYVPDRWTIIYRSSIPPNIITTIPPASQSKGSLRCVYTAKYQNKDGKVEAVRFHFFNNNGDPKGKGDVVLLVAYWGDARQPQNLIETPL